MTKLGDVLEFGTFDPEGMDVSELQELSKNIPKDGHVDVAIAENLAVQFLRGADRCSEMIGKLTWWLARKKDASRREYQMAALVRAKGQGYKSAAEKKLYADGDDKYLDACADVSKAEAMLQWCKNKHSSLVSAHYLMKQIARGEEGHGRASNVTVGSGPLSHGEQQW